MNAASTAPVGFTRSVTGIFLVLCAAFIPFPLLNFTFQQKITELLFSNLIGAVYHFLTGMKLRVTGISSDSSSMYLLVFLLLFFAAIAALIPFIKKKSGNINSVNYKICCGYLCFVLLKYGLDKIFKTQFYLPEPNILFTPAGHLDKDILYWSAMGSSRVFNLATGAIEILAAILLFFKRTKHAGILMAMVVLANVLLINISFNISVKLFSTILLSMALYLWAPFCKNFFQAVFRLTKPAQQVSFVKRMGNVELLKYFIGAGALFLLLVPYIESGNFNDDKAARPYLHGAYEVTGVFEGQNSLPAQNLPVKRVFIHRNGYLIFQKPNEQMSDHRIQYDTANKLLVLHNYKGQQNIIHYRYVNNDSSLSLSYVQNGKKITLVSREINWRKMPLLKDGFNWTSDF